mgnify:CR=1 FL=1
MLVKTFFGANMRACAAFATGSPDKKRPGIAARSGVLGAAGAARKRYFFAGAVGLAAALTGFAFSCGQ